mmetsp:Transcript_22977/g.34226  ORF Transcript_22977/g.34226 Transcript_22977/m.34226 type:complete len:250 (+) Transcript_22977:55-804(+)
MKFQFLLSVIAVVAQTSTALAAAGGPPTLKYFDARGAAETARIILTFAGEEYNDSRYEIEPGTMSAPEFLKAKETGELDMNLNRVPLLITEGGEIIGQSKAIERYLAKKFGLMGSSDVEAAQIDCVAEHCRDVKDAAARKGFSFFSQKSDEEKAVARKEWFESDLPAMLEKIEKSVSLTSTESGYAVGNKSSYADIAIFSLLKDCTMEAEKEDTLKAAEKCSALLAIANKIASDEKIVAWVESRPKTRF